MKKYIIIFLALVAFKNYSQNVDSFFTKTNSFLSKNVVDGKVAYARIYKSQDELNEILLIARKISLTNDDELTYQSFWINAYNLLVIKGIVDNYPTNSPLDIDGFFDKTKYDIGRKNITLNDIENEMLRSVIKDARFHFVLVCGAIGCPPLISEAYLPNTLDNQLDKQTNIALNGDFLKVNTKKKRVEVSEIMKWYKEDFTMNGSNEIDFINTYRNEKVPNDFKISYFPYNWNINKQ